MMDGTFVKELHERFSQPRDVDGLVGLPHGWTLHDPAALVKPGPMPETLKVYSLGAVRDYLKANRDALDLETLAVHVVSPQIVRVVSSLGARANERAIFLEAVATNLTDNFTGKFIAHEEFVIGLQTRFADAEQRADVLRVIGNIRSDAVTTSVDDGVSQSVELRSGVALVRKGEVPNPVKLVPFRTFREVAQPPSLFVLRVNQSHQAALFEADGGAWRQDAVVAVAGWLGHELEDTGVAVLA